MRDPKPFCEAMTAWSGAATMALASDAESTREWRHEFAEHWQFIERAIRKSCLLERLLYGGEKLRSRPCPVHKGRWSGITSPPCKHCGVGPTCQCNTGWLPE